MSPFIARFLANVCEGIVRSLKTPAANGRIRFDLFEGRARLEVDGSAVDLEDGQGFAATIVHGTLTGMLRDLKGIDAQRSIRLEVDLVEEHAKS